MQTFYQLTQMDSPIGRLHLLARNEVIVAISFNNPAHFGKGYPLKESPHALSSVKEQILEYFDGTRKSFDFPMQLEGLNPFTERVLLHMSRIPYGQTRTYGEIAAEIGSPLAFRAVGAACKQNRILLALGCHRVVARSGIGGFSCGLWRKEFLLRHEQKVLNLNYKADPKRGQLLGRKKT